jgi:hypothetical protein
VGRPSAADLGGEHQRHHHQQWSLRGQKEIDGAPSMTRPLDRGRSGRVKAVIAAIPEGEWKAFRDGEIAETVHRMNKTDKAFRLIVLRRPRELASGPP